MGPARFDALAAALTARLTRRRALGTVGVAGLAVAAAGRAAHGGAVAQDDDMSRQTCALDFAATVAIGPSAGRAIAGKLKLKIGPDGAIDSASLTTTDGQGYVAVGQALGRALQLRITVADGQFVALAGTGEQAVRLCSGRIDGTFGGPQGHDLGTWSAVPSGAGGR